MTARGGIRLFAQLNRWLNLDFIQNDEMEKNI